MTEDKNLSPTVTAEEIAAWKREAAEYPRLGPYAGIGTFIRRVERLCDAFLALQKENARLTPELSRANTSEVKLGQMLEERREKIVEMEEKQ